jgi:hypothetical protein
MFLFLHFASSLWMYHSDIAFFVPEVSTNFKNYTVQSIPNDLDRIP